MFTITNVNIKKLSKHVINMHQACKIFISEYFNYFTCCFRSSSKHKVTLITSLHIVKARTLNFRPPNGVCTKINTVRKLIPYENFCCTESFLVRKFLLYEN